MTRATPGVRAAIGAFLLAGTLPLGLSADQAAVRAHVEKLASEPLQGRLTGSEGENLAADYLIAQLKQMGAKPLPGQTDYRSSFRFTAGTRDGGSRVRLGCRPPGAGNEAANACAPTAFADTKDVRALSFSDNGDVAAPVVFAGYGIVVPDSQGIGYDSYAGLDVKDKVVLVLRYFPEEAEPKRKGILARYADLRYKAMAARQHGARAMLVVTGPRSPNAGETIPFSFDTALAGSGIVAASISGTAAAAMFRMGFDDPDKTLDAAQGALDQGAPVPGFEIPRLAVDVHAAVVREARTGHNVLAYLPATVSTTGVSKPWVALGAHFDHLGHGENGNSLANKAEAGQIHFGADDNASGTAAVLAAGARLSAQPRRRHVALQFWSGEELGLVGSSAYAASPAVPLDQVAAYLNFDMVGRAQDNKLSVQATGTSPAWNRLIEQANVAAGFDLQLQPDPYQPTDVATFNLAGVPVLNFFTGTHTDYHRPTDTAEKIDFEDLSRIADFGAAIARRVADLDVPPAFTKVEQRVQGGGGRAGVRIFTGTIPDYAADVKGLLLGGVVGGGPAEAAGLQKGDVVVEIAGQTITNIYDYTYALDLLKIGQPAKVVYLRGGARRETSLTPAARK